MCQNMYVSYDIKSELYKVVKELNIKDRNGFKKGQMVL